MAQRHNYPIDYEQNSPHRYDGYGESFPPGFPFDDTSRWRNRGDSDLRHRLDEIAQRYPQFADQLRDWTSEGESPSGMGWGSKTQSQPSTPQQTTEAAPQAPAQQQPQAQPAGPAGPEGDVRTQRAMSAPPDNRAKDQPQRFVSRLEINPNNTAGEAAQPQQAAQPQAAQPQPQPQPQPQQPAQPEPKKKASNVRHIPIFVEDRNETVMPRGDVDSSTADFGKSFGSPPRERDSRDREDGFHGPAYAKYAPSGFGFMNKPWHSYKRTSPFMREPSQHQQHHQPQFHHSQPSHSHPQSQQQHPQQQHPNPQPQQTHPQQTHPQQTHPQQSHPQQQQPPQQPHPEPPRQETPPRQPPPKPKDPLEEVAAVQQDVDELMKQVEAFVGTRQDKQYIYLDEMLTRNLLKLDLVETEGKENVRAARKETIRCIQKGISILESKTMTPEEIAEREKAMEVDPEPEVQSMEVSTEVLGEPAPTETAATVEAAAAAPTSSSTPAPEAPSESTPTPAPAPTSEAPSAPAEQASTESKETSTAAAPETPVQAEATEPRVTETSTPPVNNAAAEAAAPAAPAAAS